MRIEINGLTFAYTDQGQGMPVVLIHGFPLNRGMWQPQIDGLAGKLRVIAPDLRGYGGTPPTPAPYSMELFADDIIGLLDGLGITQPVVAAGLSMGGYIVMALARKYPQRLAGIVLAATRAGADSAEAQANRLKMADLARSQGAAAIAEAMLPKLLAPSTYSQRPALVEQVKAILMSASVEGIAGALHAMKDRPDSTALLPEIAAPALVIHGAEDQLMPPAEAEKSASGLANAQLELIRGAGHLPNLEQAEQFNQRLAAFAASLA